MSTARSSRPSPIDELTILVTGARAAATHLDGPSLDNCMRSLDSWFSEQHSAIARDAKLRVASMNALKEVRDLCSVLAVAIRDGLSAAAAVEPAERYGRKSTASVPASTNPVLTRRYG